MHGLVLQAQDISNIRNFRNRYQCGKIETSICAIFDMGQKIMKFLCVQKQGFKYRRVLAKVYRWPLAKIRKASIGSLPNRRYGTNRRFGRVRPLEWPYINRGSNRRYSPHETEPGYCKPASGVPKLAGPLYGVR